MAKCPLCQANLADDFGLIECPSCGAQLIMHMDGRVEYQGSQMAGDSVGENVAEEGDIEIPEASVLAAPQDLGDLPEDPPYQDEPTQLAQPPVAEEAPYNFGGAEDDNAPSDFEPQRTGPLPAEAATPPTAATENDATVAMYALSDDAADAPTVVYKPPGATPDSPDLSDIARFGNSENARASDGSLRYTVFVTGIDTADVREAFREAITDRKLVWDIDQILRSLKNGEVAIENVTPPKAYILITRLRNLPVNVRWEQYAISQT